MRNKFDPHDEDCLSEQNNKKMTFEDNIHQGESETIFRNSLREMPAELKKVNKVHDSQTSSQRPRTNDIASKFDGVGPPNFYEADLEKWVNKKFSKAQTFRNTQKEIN